MTVIVSQAHAKNHRYLAIVLDRAFHSDLAWKNMPELVGEQSEIRSHQEPRTYGTFQMFEPLASTLMPTVCRYLPNRGSLANSFTVRGITVTSTAVLAAERS
jgi:hypothetical protein